MHFIQVEHSTPHIGQPQSLPRSSLRDSNILHTATFYRGIYIFHYFCPFYQLTGLRRVYAAGKNNNNGPLKPEYEIAQRVVCADEKKRTTRAI